MNKEFQKKAQNLVDIYYPYELDYSISDEEKSKYLVEWYYKNMNLLYEYNLTYSILLNCVKDSKVTFHDGCKEFLNRMNKHNIPVIILSAGIGNVIYEFLKLHECLFPNISIVSNFIKFENDKMLPFTDNMIHTSNKSISLLPKSLQEEVLLKDYVLVFGDLVEDLNMVKGIDVNKILSFGFLENRVNENLQYYQNAYDVVLTSGNSFVDINNIIDKLYR